LIQLLIGIFNSDPSLNSFIVDAEVVAIDPQTGELRSFQELAGRARRDVQLGSIKVMVSLFLFDIMLLNGDVSLLSTRERSAPHDFKDIDTVSV
jgi:DNA ligase-1